MFMRVLPAIISRIISGGGGGTLINDLQAWYKMDAASGDVIDAHSNNSLTEEGAIGSATGVVNNCRTFAHSTRDGAFVTNNAFDWNGVGFTVAGWLYMETAFNSGNVISYASEASYGLTSGNTQWRLYWNGSNLQFYGGTDNSWGGVVSRAASKGEWIFFVGMYNHTTGKVFLSLNNGTPHEISNTLNEETGSDTLRIADNGSFTADIRLDEVGVWGRALTSDEITELYNSGSGITYEDIVTPIEPTNPGNTNLISWWNFNEASGNILDSHGAYDLTAVSATYGAAGVVDDAISFAGVQSARTGTNDAVWEPDNDFTICCWFYPTGVTTTETIVSNYYSLTGDGWMVRIYSDGSVNFAMKMTDNNWTTTSAPAGTVTANNWYFLTCTYDSATDTLTIFIDGDEKDSDVMAFGPKVYTDTQLAFGCLGYGGNVQNMPGRIDESCFYERKLTEGEIAWLYNAGSGRRYADLTPVIPPAYDPYFVNNTLLLHMNGADASTEFIDDSWKSATVTPAGNAQIDTAQSKYGGASGYFDGTGDYLTIPYVYAYHNWFEEDFTLECWVRAASWTGWDQTAGIPVMIGNMGPTSISNYWSFGPRPDGTLAFHYYNGGANIILASTGTLAVDTWHHIALTYDHSTGDIDLWINGVNDGGGTKSGTPLVSLTYPLSIGSYNNYEITGWIDDLRITKGVVRYTGTFTPPETEHLGPQLFTGIRQDMVAWYALDETSGTRVDSHARGLDLTDDTTTGYITGKQGNAADFVSDYMSSPAGFPMVAGDNSWSACCWVNWDSFGSDPYVMMFGQAGSGAITGYNWYLTTNGSYHRVVIAVGGSWTICLDTQVAISTGTWYFAYMQYDADTNKLGISIDNNTLIEVTVVGTPNAVANPTFRVGSQRGGYGYFDGKIDEVACWNRLLTSDERSQLYNSGNGMPYPIGDPTDIQGLVIWLDASDPGTVPNKWVDKSGNLNDFEKDASYGFPQIINGDALFNGSDGINGPDLSSLTEGEIFAKVFGATDVGNESLWDFGSNTSTSNQSHYPWASSIYDTFGSDQPQKVVGNPAKTLVAWRTLNVWSVTNDWSFNIDGVSQYSTGANTVGFPTECALGYGHDSRGDSFDYFFSGKVRSLALYDHKLTLTERLSLNAYMDNLPKGGWSPTDLVGLSHWFDNENIGDFYEYSGRITPVEQVDDPVGTWADKSGNANDFEQITQLRRPVFKGRFVQNNNSQLYMQTPSWVQTDEWILGIRCKLVYTSDPDPVFSIANSPTSSTPAVLVTTSNTSLRIYVDGGYQWEVPWTSGNEYTIVMRTTYSASTYYCDCWINGVKQTQYNGGVSYSYKGTNPLYLLSGFGGQGNHDIRGVICAEGSYTDIDAENLSGYLDSL